MGEKEEKKTMSPMSLAKIAEKKKQLTPEMKQEMIKAGGSVKTKLAVDAEELCREIRGK